MHESLALTCRDQHCGLELLFILRLWLHIKQVTTKKLNRVKR